MARNTYWPAGVLKRVSREAYDAVTRSRGFDYMTPAGREASAKAYDDLKKVSRWRQLYKKAHRRG